MKSPLCLISSAVILALFGAANSALGDVYSDAVAADSPIAYWRLGDGGNPVVDTVGGNNGTATAGVNFNQASLLSAFPGNTSVNTIGNERIATAGFAKGPSYSAEYWVRVNAAPTGFHNIVGDGESGGDFFMMNYLTGGGRIRPHYSAANAPVSTDSNAVLQTNLPYHVVTTYDNTAGSASIYINGTLDKTIAVSTNAPTNTGNPIYIGKDDREAGGNLNLQDVALYNSSLTAAQVRTHRAIGYAGNDVPASLRQYWSFDESDSGTGTAVPLFGTSNFGAFTGTADRTTGLIGTGAASFNNTAGDGVNVGTSGFSFTTGFTLEALIAPTWDGLAGYDEIFRKEDGGNRILLSFQNDGFDTVNGPVLGFGLNVGGTYGELNMPLDGSAGITLADLTDGELHQVVAIYDSVTGEKSIYIDGEERFSETLAGIIASGGGAAAFIGNLNNGGEPFSGIIDEVALFDAALSPEEIAAHFSNVQNGLNFFAQAQAVPEPSSLAVWGVLGIMGLGALRLRRSRRGR